MAADCLFCKIVAGEIPATVVHDGPEVLAFADLAPKAPTHVLVIPKRHFADIGELAADPQAAAAVVAGVGAVAAELGVSSYRTVFNTGSDAGQTVFHVHAHLLAGRPLEWPPG
ncbi:MAG: HIT domain-containing protein [Actinomycetota bacterium]|nr:HIT domain-containing protein [Actinomycetota bacterium]MDQ2959245.1 HIT domain-containing protein [Actinomycetota bacterium]